MSNDSERSEVYVRASAGGERRWQVSLAGGTDPVWARSGRELFYRQENDMMAVDVSTAGAMFTSGRPRKLFTARHAGGVVASYDVSADGRRFLMVRAPTGGDTREIRVALRWLDEVTQARSSPASSRARE